MKRFNLIVVQSREQQLILSGVVQSQPNTLPQDTKILKYEFMPDEEDFVVKFELSGTDYTGNDKFCRILISNANSEAFGEITSCPGAVDSITSECVKECTSDNFKMDPTKFPKDTEYMLIKVGSKSDVKKDSDGQVVKGDVFGFNVPIIYTPKFKVSEENKKLKLAAKTLPNVSCPIVFDNVEYQPGTAATNQNTFNSANTVDYGLYLPYYEVRCSKLPSFYYFMPNKYIKTKIEEYKPQFYVVKKTSDSVKQLELKFQNILEGEICKFKVKSALNSNQGNFESKCGLDNSGDCFSLCKDVVLTTSTELTLVKIEIETREYKEENAFKYDHYGI